MAAWFCETTHCTINRSDREVTERAHVSSNQVLKLFTLDRQDCDCIRNHSRTGMCISMGMCKDKRMGRHKNKNMDLLHLSQSGGRAQCQSRMLARLRHCCLLQQPRNRDMTHQKTSEKTTFILPKTHTYAQLNFLTCQIFVKLRTETLKLHTNNKI